MIGTLQADHRRGAIAFCKKFRYFSDVNVARKRPWRHTRVMEARAHSGGVPVGCQYK